MAKRKDISVVDFLFVGSLALIICVALSIAGIQACGGLNIEYSEGSRSGVIQKISKKGLIWHTWEGELNLGYVTATRSKEGSQMAPAIFRFSCSSDEVAKVLQEREISAEFVTLEYKQYLLRGWNYGATGYDIVGLRERSR